LKISFQLDLLTIYRIEILTANTFLRKETRENDRNVHASIAHLDAPVSDCGMGLTARRNEVWRRGVVGGRNSTLPS
jgi:hypothetical protein